MRFLYTWYALLFIVGLSAAFLTGRNLIEVWSYLSCNHYKPVTQVKWDVKSLGPSKHAIYAKYAFEADGARVHGKTQFQKPIYLNYYSAKDDLPLWENKSWSVWYNPHNPSKSTLEKLLPWKGGLYALMGLGIFFYFFYLFAKHSRTLTKDQE